MVSAGGVERYRVRAVRPVRANYLSFCLRKLVFWESGAEECQTITQDHSPCQKSQQNSKNENTKEQPIERA